MAVVATKCKNCGAELKYQPEVDGWKCEFCDAAYTLEQLSHMEVSEQPAGKNKAVAMPEEEQSTDGTEGALVRYQCPHCHAQVITTAETAATACVYCGRPLLMGETLTGENTPTFVIPFATTKEQAMQTFRAHAKKKPFLPKAFLSDVQIQKITGMYVPFFLHDCAMDGSLTAQGDTVRSWSDSNYRYTETTTYAVQREGSMAFHKIPTDASLKLENAIIDALEPFDYSKLTEFSSAYLAGFFAEKNTEDLEPCRNRGLERARKSMERELRQSCSKYSSLRVSDSSLQVQEVSSDYGMLPVWLLYTTYKKQNYLFAMNGQTGKFVGEFPVDKGRAAAKSVGATGIALGVAGLLTTLYLLIGGLFG